MNKASQARQWMELALAQLEAGFADEALTLIRKCLELGPDEPLPRLIEARIELARFQPRKALAALDAHDAMEAGASHLDGLLLRVRALLQSGRQEAGDAMLEQLVNDFPQDARPLRLAAARALQRDDRRRAAQCLRTVIDLDAHDLAARRTLATLLAEEDPQQAVDVLQHGWSAPHRDERLAAARLYRQAGRATDAEDAYSELLSAHPNDATIWLEAGLLADEVGDSRRAIARLQRAVELGGRTRGSALAGLARTQMHAGRFAQAGRCWWRLVRLDENDIDACAGLVICALVSENHAVARRAMRQLLLMGTRWQRRRHLAQHWRHAAAALAGSVNVQAGPIVSPLDELLAQAADAFEMHAQRHPGRADTFYHLGICRESLNDVQRAAQAASQALAINPNYAAAAALARRVA